MARGVCSQAARRRASVSSFLCRAVKPNPRIRTPPEIKAVAGADPYLSVANFQSGRDRGEAAPGMRCSILRLFK